MCRLTGWRVAGGMAGLVLWLGAAAGQSLAHKGWAGNGLAVAPWWEGAVFYAIRAGDVAGAEGSEDGVRGLEEQLDGLRAQEVDALMLGELDQSKAEEFDRVVGEATRRRLRVVVDLPVNDGETAAELADGARFWLSRGAAGLRLVTGSEDAGGRVESTDRFGELERLVAGFSGQRVLIWDVPAGITAATPLRTRRGTRRRSHLAGAAAERVIVDHWMQGWTALDAGGLRRVLAAEMESARRGGGIAPAAKLIDGEDVRALLAGRGGGDTVEAQRAAAALMLGGEAPVVVAGMEGRGELAKWYGMLGAVRHGNAAVREGRMELLYAGNADVVAWVRVARAGGVVSPAVLVVENFSDRPVVLRLGAELRRAGVATGGGALLTMAASDGGDAGTVNVDALKVEAGAVFVGGLEGSPGLEAGPEPARRRRR